MTTTIGGRSVVLDTWTAPAALDKVATFSGRPHPGTLVVPAPAWWCALSLAVMTKLLDRHPDVRWHVLSVVAEAASRARTSFVDVATRPSLSRLAAWLLATSEQDEAVLPRPQEQLAHRLGMTRVTLNRALNHLVKAGILRLDGSTVTIQDSHKLRAVADGE